jgi:hypothetical protein
MKEYLRTVATSNTDIDEMIALKERLKESGIEPTEVKLVGVFRVTEGSVILEEQAELKGVIK